MVESYDALGVNQHVPSLLDSVSARHPRKPPLERLARIRAHGGEAPQMAETRLLHVVRVVESPVCVHEERPDQPGLVQILTSRLPALEGHDECLDLQPIQLVARFLQLQQVSAARQSEQMPMEHQQQPAAAVVFEPILSVVGIAQRERHRGAAGELRHEK